MHLQHSVVELEVLLGRVERGELETGWDAAGRWDRRQRQLLVDTVLRSWPIPPLVIAGDDERDVLLDGRERLRALWAFTRDELAVAGPAAAPGEYLEQLDGLRFSHLPERFRRRVRCYGVPVVRVPASADAEVRELMARWAPAGAAPPAAPVPHLEEPPTVPPPPAPAPSSPDPLPVPVQTSHRPAPPEPDDATAPFAAIDRPSGAHRRATEGEPIFDELSAWFLDAVAPEGTPAGGWSSPADTGQAAARSALRQDTDELTPAGLPMRRPSAHLAPGSIQTPARTRPSRPLDPRAISDSLNRFREGATAARDDLSPPA